MCLQKQILLMKKLIYSLSLILVCVFLSSCATAPKPTPRVTKDPTPPSIKRSDIYHVVGPGETLWRISKTYDVPIKRILRANRISERAILQMGQQIKIPMATDPKPVISLYPSSKWRYIIVHHSATEVGNSLAFHKAHLKRGWDRGIGYHFVVSNNSSDRKEGQIEATPRWIKQQDGAHCKASEMNTKAIGICLVGNFNNQNPSKKQLDSLNYIVKKLQDFYNIPTSRVLRHGEVHGVITDCPGHNFPWQGFKNRLD